MPSKARFHSLLLPQVHVIKEIGRLTILTKIKIVSCLLILGTWALIFNINTNAENINTIIINDAHKFGATLLKQLEDNPNSLTDKNSTTAFSLQHIAKIKFPAKLRNQFQHINALTRASISIHNKLLKIDDNDIRLGFTQGVIQKITENLSDDIFLLMSQKHKHKSLETVALKTNLRILIFNTIKYFPNNQKKYLQLKNIINEFNHGNRQTLINSIRIFINNLAVDYVFLIKNNFKKYPGDIAIAYRNAQMDMIDYFNRKKSDTFDKKSSSIISTKELKL